MALQKIDIDTVQPNGKRGDPARLMAQKINANIDEQIARDTAQAETNTQLQQAISKAASDLPFISVDRGAISFNGLLLSFAGSTLTLSAGVAFIPSLDKLLVVGAPISKALSGMTPSTWYHVYLFAKADGAADFEVVITAPSAPYSGTARFKGTDNTRRYLGSIRVGGSGVLKFEHRGNQIIYLEDTQAAPFLVLAAGSSTVTATVSAAQVAPVTAYAVSINALNAATNGAYTRLSNSKGPSAQSGYLALASPGGVSAVTLSVDSSQAYTYAYDSNPSPAGAAYHRISGYFFER